MKWITRARPKTDRIACPWLIRRFIDPDAQFLFVPTDEVLEVTTREGGYSFDARGATYTHRRGPDGEQCTFEVLIDEYHLGGDPALARLARVVHAADISGDLHTDPLGPGLLAIGTGGLSVETDDQRLLERGLFVYDALYAWCRQQDRRTVVFVCAHGAARSRLAAAWFNADPPAGWHATTGAAEEPAPALNPRVAGLLAGTRARDHLDTEPPRPFAAGDLVVAIDCAVPGAQRWDLHATEVDEAMRDELRHLVTTVTRTLTG
jgi:hypothetical protein